MKSKHILHKASAANYKTVSVLVYSAVRYFRWVVARVRLDKKKLIKCIAYSIHLGAVSTVNVRVELIRRGKQVQLNLC